MGVKPSLNNAGTRVGGSDQRQTTCSVCRFGIYEGQPRRWSRQPLGLVHTDCAPQESQ